MTEQVFNDLSQLFHVQYTSRILVIFDDLAAYKIGFKQHPEDKQEKRIPFITYIGGNAKEELKAIASCYEISGYNIRKATRIDYPFEMKIKGMAFGKLQQLIKELNDE